MFISMNKYCLNQIYSALLIWKSRSSYSLYLAYVSAGGSQVPEDTCRQGGITVDFGQFASKEYIQNYLSSIYRI